MDFNLTLLSQVLAITLIDIVLSGDNAVVIALACKSLPPKQKRWGIILGAGAAVLLRVILTFFASQLLVIPYLKTIGGILIGWIAIKLFLESGAEGKVKEATSLPHAIRMIVVADFVMSTDNVLAVAGASRGSLPLLLFGLALSIPLVVGTSTLLSMLMEKYPIIVYLGSAVLGSVAGEMIMTDPAFVAKFHPAKWLVYAVEAACAVGVIVIGKLWARRKDRRAEAAGGEIPAEAQPQAPGAPPAA